MVKSKKKKKNPENGRQKPPPPIIIIIIIMIIIIIILYIINLLSHPCRQYMFTLCNVCTVIGYGRGQNWDGREQ